MQIVLAPEDAAAGKITLSSPKRIDIRSGAGLLLNVEKQQASGTGAP
jgi:hypothetical protein